MGDRATPNPRVVDFDSFRRERTDDPVILRIDGEDYTLPSQLPAIVALDVLRLQREEGNDAEANAQAVSQMAEAIFGDQLRPIIVKHNIAMDELADLLMETLRIYGGISDDPNPAARSNRAKQLSRQSRNGT